MLATREWDSTSTAPPAAPERPPESGTGKEDGRLFRVTSKVQKRGAVRKIGARMGMEVECARRADTGIVQAPAKQPVNR